jgi:hypothetical protein
LTDLLLSPDHFLCTFKLPAVFLEKNLDIDADFIYNYRWEKFDDLPPAPKSLLWKLPEPSNETGPKLFSKTRRSFASLQRIRRKIMFQFRLITILILSLFSLFWIGCGGGGGGGGSSGGGGSPGNGGTINLGWSANTESDLAGYRVYYGTSSGNYGNPIDVGMGTPSGGLTTYSLTNLTKGQTYCIAITAYDTSNNESSRSNEACGEAQ